MTTIRGRGGLQLAGRPGGALTAGRVRVVRLAAGRQSVLQTDISRRLT